MPKAYSRCARSPVAPHRATACDARRSAARGGPNLRPAFPAAGLAEKNVEGRSMPNWIEVDLSLMTAKMTALPSYTPGETGLDYATVFEFYSR